MRRREVTPDVFVRRTRGGFAVELNQATLPRLLVNRRYYQELKSGPQDKPSRAWLSECLQSANWLVKALDQRARTIVKVVSRDREAAAGLFRARRVGDEADDPARGRRGDRNARIDRQPRHLEQISAVRPRALELKYFFGSGVASAEGDGAAAEAVKAAIKQLIDAETEILSDDAIAGLLKKKGFDVARRTVVKYREVDGHRLVDPAAAAEEDRGVVLSGRRAAPRSADGRTPGGQRRSCARRQLRC